MKRLASNNAVLINGGRMTRPRTQTPDKSRYSGRFAIRLMELRQAAGLSVEKLAEKMTKAGYPIAAPTLWHWEGGNRQPALDAVPVLAKCLKVEIRQLFPQK